MLHEKIKNLFSEAVSSVVSNISKYVIHSEKDLTRNKKFPTDKLLPIWYPVVLQVLKLSYLIFLAWLLIHHLLQRLINNVPN